MAERLKTFDFTAQSAITSAESKGRNRYPWTEWFDGDIWKITQGDDFDTSPLMMERIIRTRASNKNHRAKVKLRHLPALNGESPSIVLQRTDIVGPSAAKKAGAAEKRKARAKPAAPRKVSKRPTKKVGAARKAPAVATNGEASGPSDD